MAPSTPLDFSLHPFDAGRAPPDLRLGGRVERQAELIRLAWHLEGAIASLRIPPPEPVPRRLDELWTSTCFECFLAIEGERPYWEFNLSPAGHWNVYVLEDYRSGLRAEPAYRALAPLLEAGERSLSLRLAFPLPPAIPAGAPLCLGVTAVIEAAGGDLSYWGLSHPGAEPDFHHREGFQLLL